MHSGFAFFATGCMIKIFMIKFRFLVALACATGASGSWAAAIAISSTQQLAFGSMVAGAGGSVTVGISPLGRSASGGVFVLPSGTWTAASFRVTGDASATYSISLPANDVVMLSSGANTMAVNNFTSNPASGTLDINGSQNVMIGATLNVGSNQPTGNYSGSYTVTVNYN